MSRFNEKISGHFSTLSEIYLKMGESYKSRTFSRFSDLVLDMEDITEEKSGVTHIKGVGTSTQIEVDEFIKTGTSTRLEGLKGENQEKMNREPAEEEGAIAYLLWKMEKHMSSLIIVEALNAVKLQSGLIYGRRLIGRGDLGELLEAGKFSSRVLGTDSEVGIFKIINEITSNINNHNQEK